MPGWLAFKRSKKRSKVADTYLNAILLLSHIGIQYECLACTPECYSSSHRKLIQISVFAGTLKIDRHICRIIMNIAVSRILQLARPIE
jgi:hypothetical protein